MVKAEIKFQLHFGLVLAESCVGGSRKNELGVVTENSSQCPPHEASAGQTDEQTIVIVSYSHTSGKADTCTININF